MQATTMLVPLFIFLQAWDMCEVPFKVFLVSRTINNFGKKLYPERRLPSRPPLRRGLWQVLLRGERVQLSLLGRPLQLPAGDSPRLLPVAGREERGAERRVQLE